LVEDGEPLLVLFSHVSDVFAVRAEDGGLAHDSVVLPALFSIYDDKGLFRGLVRRRIWLVG
jgi:hypothetical protein